MVGSVASVEWDPAPIWCYLGRERSAASLGDLITVWR
jgi:hypothetical protein